MRKHFATFYSPGTFVAEQSTEPIESWDVDLAAKMAHDICERYHAIPYGFRFSTRERGENDLDSHESESSPMYYLGGEILTVADVEARNDPNDRILICNVKGNGYDRIIVNTNSWKWVQPLGDDDVVLDWKKAS